MRPDWTARASRTSTFTGTSAGCALSPPSDTRIARIEPYARQSALKVYGPLNYRHFATDGEDVNVSEGVLSDLDNAWRVYRLYYRQAGALIRLISEQTGVAVTVIDQSNVEEVGIPGGGPSALSCSPLGRSRTLVLSH